MPRHEAKIEFAGHAPTKQSVINLKRICPMACREPFSQLEYLASDPLYNGKASITWWTGKHDEECESRYEIVFSQSRQKLFEIPGIPFKFIIVNGEIYYRQNVEY